VWWTWDPRLTTTAILLTIFVGYLMLRAAHDDPLVRARRSAVLALIGFADVPVIHMSVLWWRSLHQPPSLLAPNGGKPSLAAPMAAELMLMVVGFTLLYLTLLWYRRDLAEDEARSLPWLAELDAEASSAASGTPSKPTRLVAP
jgi:heme exporter protein C